MESSPRRRPPGKREPVEIANVPNIANVPSAAPDATNADKAMRDGVRFYASIIKSVETPTLRLQAIKAVFYALAASVSSLYGLYYALQYFAGAQGRSIIVVIGLFLASRLSSDARWLFLSRVEPLLTHRMSAEILDRMLNRPAGSMVDQKSMRIQPLIGGSEAALRTIAMSTIVHVLPLCAEIVTMIGVTAAIARIEVVLFLACFLIGYTALSLHLTRQLATKIEDASESSIAARGTMIDWIRNAFLIQILDSHSSIRNRFEKLGTNRIQKSQEITRHRAYAGLLTVCFIGAALSLFLLLHNSDDMNSSERMELFFIYMLVVFLVRPIDSLGIQLREIQRSFVTLGRMAELLQAPSRPITPSTSSTSRRIIGGLRVADFIPVTHDGSRRPFSFQVEPGEHVAIVGESGIGKSTLVQAIAGLRESYSGEIYVDEIEVKSWKPADLRRDIGFLLSETFLLNDSIEENIRLANEALSNDELSKLMVRWRLSRYRNRDFAGSTQTGDRGLRISAGERQRVAIARLFSRPASMLIADEATSSLDRELEREIIADLLREMQGKTVVWVTHRWDNIDLFGRVIRLSDTEPAA